MANGRGGQIAGDTVGIASTAVTSSMFIAAAAANAVPVAGQVAAGILALGAGLTKAFAGKKRAREAQQREATRAAQQANIADVSRQPQGAQVATLGGGMPHQAPMGTVPVQTAQAPTLQYTGGQEPSVQPQRLGGS